MSDQSDPDVIPNYEPDCISTGATVQWTKRLASFPASSWSAKWLLRGATPPGLDVTATIDPDDADGFLVTITPEQSATLSPGTVYYQIWVTNRTDATKVYEAGKASFKVVVGFAATEPGDVVDNRSQARKIVDAIDALMSNTATLVQRQYMVVGLHGGQRQLERVPLSELQQTRQYYARIVANEQAAEDVANGIPYLKNVNIKFVRP